jgi:hypothetical protein
MNGLVAAKRLMQCAAGIRLRTAGAMHERPAYACGVLPIRVLVCIASEHSWAPTLTGSVVRTCADAVVALAAPALVAELGGCSSLHVGPALLQDPQQVDAVMGALIPTV